MDGLASLFLVCLVAVSVAMLAMITGDRPNAATWLTIAAILSLFALIFLITYAFGDDFQGSPPSETGMRLLNLANVAALILILIGFIRSNKKLSLGFLIAVAAFFWYWSMFYAAMSISRTWI
ncbi:MAG: hypothetical protein KIT74_07285 [Fimbriimonadales bacterium]|nr:hypothetical protein [Fimbriimonadales bacterium]